MIHFQRNLKLVFFLILPILGFLLGWSLSFKFSNSTPSSSLPLQIPSETVSSKNTDKSSENIMQFGADRLKKFIAHPKRPQDVDLTIFWETWGYLTENYLHQEKFRTQDQVYGATKGLVSSLKDPYTVFLNPTESKQFDDSLSGQFEGIGAEVGIKNDQIVIVSPLKGSPAEKSGVRSGDIIFKINNQSTQGMSIEEAVTHIRGPKGEKVDLTVLREGVSEPMTISIVRDTIVLKSVEMDMKDDIAVITLSQFGSDTEQEFQTALQDVLSKKPKGLILDLRNDGGGLLDVCVKIASEFLSKKVIVETKGRNFGDSGTLMSDDGGQLLDMPLIVLVNRGTASASEIFAGAIQDYGRGLVLGEKTFGKGSVQNVIPLSDGSSLKVTIAEWVTPLGRTIQEKGIDPDEIVPMTYDDIKANRDPVMDRALKLMGTDDMKNLINQKFQERQKVAGKK